MPKQRTKDKNPSKECAICFEQKELSVLFGCDHFVCFQCFESIGKGHTALCPFCRRTYDVPKSRAKKTKKKKKSSQGVLMTFGQHKGKSVDDVFVMYPGYVEWMWRAIPDLETKYPVVYERLAELFETV